MNSFSSGKDRSHL